MKTGISTVALVSVLGVVSANPAADPAPPETTAGPSPAVVAELLKRQAQNFIGYYPSNVVGGTTDWDSYTCNAGYTFYSAPGYFKCCSTAGACNIYTGCSGTYLMGPATSFACSSLASGAFCSYDLLFPSPGAITAQSYVWCGTGAETGTNIFRATGTGAAAASSSSTSTSKSSSGSSSSSSSVSFTSGTPLSAISGKKKSSPVGAIVGGIIGGLAVIGLAIAGVLFLCLRKRRNDRNAAQPAAVAAMNNSEKPGMVQHANEVPQGQYPQNGYAQYPPQNNYGVAPVPQQQQQYGGYYGDAKAVDPAQQQQQYPQQQQYGHSPQGAAAYPANPHDSMYKPPMNQQSPAQNTFELDSASQPANTPSPQTANVQPSHNGLSPQQNGPVELATPVSSPPPRYSNLGPNQH